MGVRQKNSVGIVSGSVGSTTPVPTQTTAVNRQSGTVATPTTTTTVAAEIINLTAGTGLSGGGDTSADRTFNIDINELVNLAPLATGEFVYQITAGGGVRKTTLAGLAAVVDHNLLNNLTWSTAGHTINATIAMVDNDISGLKDLLFTDEDGYIGYVGALTHLQVKNLLDKTATESLSGLYTWTANGIKLNDGLKVVFGTGSDGNIYESSGDFIIENATEDKDIIFKINDGTPATTIGTFDTSKGSFILGDGSVSSSILSVGSGAIGAPLVDARLDVDGLAAVSNTCGRFRINHETTTVLGTSQVIGFVNQATIQTDGGGTFDSVVGGDTYISFNTDQTSSITTVVGQRVRLREQPGLTADQTIANCYGFYSLGENSAGTGNLNITSFAHAYFEDLPNFSGTQATVTGLWIERQTIGDTNNYGIVLAGDGAGSDLVLGAAQDASILFDGSGLVLQSDLVTATDYLKLRGGTNGIDFFVGANQEMTLTENLLTLNAGTNAIFATSGAMFFRDSDTFIFHDGTGIDIRDNARIRINNAYNLPLADGTANEILVTDGADTLAFKTVTVDIPIVLSMFDAVPERDGESHWNGGLLLLEETGTLGPTTPGDDLSIEKGIGKILLVVIASVDAVGDITVTGDSVDRDTGNVTLADTDTITLDGNSTDNSTTDSNGNIVHVFEDAYITSKWFTGTVVLSSTEVELTDVDVYHVSFEQFNDQPVITLNTFDANIFTNNANAEFDAYLFDLHITTGSKCDVENHAELHVGADGETAIADVYWRLRQGSINQALDGSTDGIWVDVHYGGFPSSTEDVTIKVWATQTQSLTLT